MASKIKSIPNHYSKAVPAKNAIRQMLRFLDVSVQLKPGKVVFADSICGDDLNEEQYPQNAHSMIGPFRLGGLNGYPFTGLTGMAALASHAPDDGAVFLFYGPHIGVSASKKAKLGQVLRPNQKKLTSCCGAAKAAIDKLKELTPRHPGEFDYQMEVIEQLFLARRSRILNAQQQIVEATEVMYEAIDERIRLLVENTKFLSPRVFLLGGVLINRDQPSPEPVADADFEVRHCQVFNTKTKKYSDILAQYQRV